MKVRFIDDPEITGTSDRFNTSSISEVLVFFDDEDRGADSCFMRDLEIDVHGTWMPMNEAFSRRDLIVDNYNERFFEPTTEEDRARGYTL